MPLKQVVLIGAGNVGWRLGLRFREKGIPVAGVFSRRFEQAEALAAALHCRPTDRLADLPALEHCLYLLAVNDEAISGVARQLSFLSGSSRIFAHTSGAVSSTALAGQLQHYGVFYPLQSFSRDRAVSFERLPICVYAPEDDTCAQLYALGQRISGSVQQVNDHQRSVLHVAAVFVNNFSNYLFGLGKEIAEAEDLSFDLLRPLIAETAAKIMEQPPEVMQTGPARRGDQATIRSHLDYLQRYPDYQDLYRMMSDLISTHYTTPKKH